MDKKGRHLWLIVSHLLGMQLVEAEGFRNYHLATFAEIGSYPGILRRPEIIPIRDMKPFHLHEIRGLGKFPCYKMGIIEPITQSLMQSFSFIPSEAFLALCVLAIDKQAFPLLWRLEMAAKQLVDETDNSISIIANAVSRKLAPFIRDTLNSVLAETKCRFKK